MESQFDRIKIGILVKRMLQDYRMKERRRIYDPEMRQKNYRIEKRNNLI